MNKIIEGFVNFLLILFAILLLIIFISSVAGLAVGIFVKAMMFFGGVGF